MDLALTELTALSPIDGRYRSVTEPLSAYLSEFGFIRYRVQFEIKYFLSLVDLGIPQLAEFPQHARALLQGAIDLFGKPDAQAVKLIEQKTNHDVKAVELFLREWFQEHGLAEYREFIHFGITSQDVNDVVVICAVRDAVEYVLLPQVCRVVDKLKRRADEWRDVVMLARTHGQPASPTRLGKELLVFVERLERELQTMRATKYVGKFGGASGNLSAHYAAYPEIDWIGFSERFLSSNFGLERAKYTTQIGPPENLAGILDNLNRIAGIGQNLAQDFWLYLMQDYLMLHADPREVGSSTMPHKVNPIEFENAEGNLGLSSALLSHLSRRLAISRLQRDLTDGTLKRNIGVAFAHLLLSFRNIQRGIDRLGPNRERIDADLAANWQIISEAVQTILRKTGSGDAYELLRTLTQGRKLDREQFSAIIGHLNVDESIREELMAITPANFVGPIF